MRKEKTGRRERGSDPRSEKREPSKRRTEQKPLQRYSVADKTEPGWTKPDGKPLRQRKKSGDEIIKEKRTYAPRERSDFSTTRGKSDFKSTRKSSDRPFDKPERGTGKAGRFSEGKRSFSADREKPFSKSRSDRDEKAFKKPFRDDKDSDGFVPKKRSYAPDRDKPFVERGSREEKPFRKTEGDERKPARFSEGKRSFAAERGKTFNQPETEGDERPFKKPFRDDKERGDFSEGKRSFAKDRGKLFDESPGKENERPFRSRRDDGKPERDFSRSKKEERPKRGKSFLKSGAPDKKPFQRFETSVKRDEKRTDKYKLKARPAVRSRSSEAVEKTTSSDGTIRLNRYIANAGICSRREADDYITAGLVSVNGEIVSELGTKVLPTDDVRYNGERLKPEKNVYVLLNKPKDYITTSEDPDGRKTVMELIAKACKERVYPVGRLDRNTTGVLLFTNDGDLAKKLTHPSSNIRKMYHVELDKTMKASDLKQMLEGIELEDGMSAVDDISYDSGGDKKQVGVELHSGKNRIVRRMFEHLGYEIRKLDRVIFAGLTKKDLPRGRWRILSETEVGLLKMQIGKSSKSSGKVGKDKSQMKLF